MKEILCLGAGLVAKPYVDYLCGHGYNVVVASRTKAKAEKLVSTYDNAEASQFNIKTDHELLETMVSSADLVCSLLPYTFHVQAAKVAIEYETPFCTTSYISDEMWALDEDAKEASIILLNECGVDPGIDHMSAKRIIDEIHTRGGEIESFTSYTGGLPAPDDNDNPFGYKLSWSPRGVLLAGTNDAHFLRDGEQVEIPASELFGNCEEMEIPGLGTFEGYPNRDSISYIDIYSIPETKTMIRGTLRYPGWCRTLKAITDLGLLSLEEQDFDGMTYYGLVSDLTGSPQNNLRTAVSELVNLEPNDSVLDRLEWLGLFDEKTIPKDTKTPLDALCNLFEQKLQYGPNERDMIVMRHQFIVNYDNKKEEITSTLIDYGHPGGDSSMSRTVALPVAIASHMILENEINLEGVFRPTLPDIYEPILNELEKHDIEFEEHRKPI
ncbi:MAG: saccharopine dehydrogenase NADP-binding domain-containing protein [Candidatus Thorarchaeota archaeon]|nr:saccharopine dehydrogenase NADP-binding domain-containing protein [Candidatus Thorarchaeota archaeon]